jgi:molybdenum cofactor cytidylyltransferase
MISAVVLAAGQSRRMGQAKMILPWGSTTVIGQVVQTLAQAGLEEIVVVTGGNRQEVEAALVGLPARTVFNPEYAAGEMLSSLQAGLGALAPQAQAVLIALGDQPQMQVEVAQAVLAAYQSSRAWVVAPSHQMRRGHPWILARPLWAEALALRPPQTLRHLLKAHAGQTAYVAVETDSILLDLDTPHDYEKFHPPISS